MAIFAVLIALIAVVAAGSGDISKFSPHIARIKVDGLITGNKRTLALIKKLEESDKVKAVIVTINSPGGTTAGSEALYEAIRKLAKKKPVVSVMGTVAASGGYITAISTDYIVARGNTITGSIGVIFQWAQVNGLLDNVGIKMNSVKSGELKAEPNMFGPMPERAKVVTEAMVKDSFDWFVKLVEKRRKLSPSDALRLSDGRVYTGRQALKEKLIDAIGGEDEAIKWLESEKKLAKNLKIIDWKRKKAANNSPWGFSILSGLLHLFGFGEIADKLTKAVSVDTTRFDGLMSVWQPGRN